VRKPVIAVGLITEFEQAEAIVSTGDADLIALARAIFPIRVGPGTRLLISARGCGRSLRDSNPCPELSRKRERDCLPNSARATVAEALRRCGTGLSARSSSNCKS